MKQDRRNFLTTTAATILGGTAAAGKSTGERNSTLSETADNLLEPAESQQEWSRVNRDLQNTSRNPNTRVPDHNIDITKTEEDNFDKDSYTIFDKDQIYIGGRLKGSVSAFNRETGEKQWDVGLGSSINYPFTVSDDFVYASATGSGGQFSAINKETGEIEHSVNSLNSVGEATYVDGQVVVTESTGTARVFDEDLSNERVFDDHHTDVNITREVTVVDDDRIIYAERENPSAGAQTYLQMLDFNADVIDSKPIDGNANNGAVLHNRLFIYNEDEDMVAIEITENGIGDEQWRTDTGDYGNNRLSPVAYQDHVIQGNGDGELHAVNTETGDKQLIDEFDTPIRSLVAGEHTLAIGNNDLESVLYDLEEAVQGDAEPVKVFDEDEWGFNTPIAVLDGKLYTQNFGSSGGFGVHAIDGDYREIDDLPAVPGQDRSPRDLNDDGLYEDVTGSGNPTVADVQALFDTMETDYMEEHSEKFNFSGLNPDEVTIFDVQALFNQLE